MNISPVQSYNSNTPKQSPNFGMHVYDIKGPSPFSLVELDRTADKIGSDFIDLIVDYSTKGKTIVTSYNCYWGNFESKMSGQNLKSFRRALEDINKQSLLKPGQSPSKLFDGRIAMTRSEMPQRVPRLKETGVHKFVRCFFGINLKNGRGTNLAGS